MTLPAWITVGELAQRTGVATSALRFYETQGLITSKRTDGNQRRFNRSTIRRVSVIRAAQRCGMSLDEISAALDKLPSDRVPLKRDWERMSTAWRRQLDERIAGLQALREELTSCIGCGCLSLQKCALFNRQDAAARFGAGPRYLLGDDPDAVMSVSTATPPSLPAADRGRLTAEAQRGKKLTEAQADDLEVLRYGGIGHPAVTASPAAVRSPG